MQVFRAMILWVLTMSAGMFVSTVQAQSAIMIPGGVSGTYQLTYSGSSHVLFPFKNGNSVTFVVNSVDNTLCINGTLVSYGAMLTSSDPRFVHLYTSTQYILRIAGNTLTEISIYQGFQSLSHNPENYLGKFTGSRVSTSTLCQNPATVLSPGAQSVVEMARLVYPTLFPGGGEAGTMEGYVYRYFAGSGAYLAVKNERVFAMGGPFGSSLVELGAVADVLTFLRNAKAQLLVLTTEEQSVLTLVEEVFPALFAGGNPLASIESYVYRYFPGSGIYIAFSGGRLFLLGGQFGNALVDLGEIGGILSALRTAREEQLLGTAPGMHWTFNGIARNVNAGSLDVTQTGFQTGSGAGLTVTLQGGDLFFSQGVRFYMQIVSPTVSPRVIPKGRYFCGLVSGASLQIRVRDDNFLTNYVGGDCYIDLARDFTQGTAAIGGFRVANGGNVITGTFNIGP